MKKEMMKVIVFILLFCSPNIVFAQDASEKLLTISDELKGIILENFDAYQKEEMSRVLATVHTQSPGYLATKNVSVQIFPVYDLKYEVMNFKYLITDGDYALVRVSQKTSKVKGPAFRNNIIDLIILFKQENGKWKLWSQDILNIEYLN